MIRYIFAIFIVFMAVVINFAVFDQNLRGGSLLLAALGANLFIISLLYFWGGAYIHRLRQAGFLIWGHALLFLAAGTGFFGLGYHSLISKSCLFLVRDGSSSNIISRVSVWIVRNNFCPWFGIVLMLFGLFMAWPSLKLLLGFMRRTGI